MVSGVLCVRVGVGIALVDVGLADVDVGDALLGLVLVDVDEDCAGADGEKMPACVRMTPISAKRTSTISAMSGHVHGLRPRRGGSSTGSS
jgi:hypothetical protein